MAVQNRAVIDPSQDAFGAALLDYLEDKDVPELVLEDRGGRTGPAMHPEWFFRSFEQWDVGTGKSCRLSSKGLSWISEPGRAALPCTCSSGACQSRLSMTRQVLQRCGGVGA
jgi:hypothetical protein